VLWQCFEYKGVKYIFLQIPGFSVPSVGSPVEEQMEVEVLEVKQPTGEKAPPTKRTRRSKR
jgi:hypothetical protein